MNKGSEETDGWMERRELVRDLESKRDSYARLAADCLVSGHEDAYYYARESADADRQHAFLIYGGVKTAEIAALYPDVRS